MCGQTTDIPLAKQMLRKKIRQQKKQYASSQLDIMSDALVQRLLEHPKVKEATVVMLYYSLPDEISTHSLIEQLVHRQKTVLLPAVVSDSEMELRRYRTPQDLRTGAYHIMEPCGEAYRHYASIDVAIIPGMAFTAKGKRLGRGKGYYDRMLAQLTKTYTIGICYPFQIVETLPCDQYDRKVDEVMFPMSITT